MTFTCKANRMESTDIVDDVNSLLKLRVGDPYRLEHIKQTYIQNQKIWITDENYLKHLKEKYLVKHISDVSSDEPIVFENESEDEEIIHCWKCGKKCPLSANFCMICGSSLFEVGSNKQSVVEKPPTSNFKKFFPLKLILVGIPVLILIIFGTAYSQGYFDSSLESSSNTITSIENEAIFYGMYDSKCGDGTVLDPDTNTCVPGLVLDSGDSKCGPGTIFDDKSNSCISR